METNYIARYAPDHVLALRKWCRAHDWGKHAQIVQRDGVWRIANLRDVVYHADGRCITSRITLPAERASVRAWAGY